MTSNTPSVPLCIVGLVLAGWALPLAAKEPVDLSSDLERVIDGSNVPGLVAAAVLEGQVAGRGAAGNPGPLRGGAIFLTTRKGPRAGKPDLDLPWT